MLKLLKMCLIALVVVVVPAPDEPVIAMIGCLADIIILVIVDTSRLKNLTILVC